MSLRTDRLCLPGLAPLVDELARRFGAGDRAVVITLRDAPLDTRRAVADLFGLARLPPPRLHVRVDRLTAALGLATTDELRAAIARLRGPLSDRRAEREANRAAKTDLWAWLADQAATLPLLGDGAAAARWVDAQRSAGVRGGLDRHRRRLHQALNVLRALPADSIALAVLADRCAGDPHALDRGHTLTAIVLDAIGIATGSDRPCDAEACRTAWESVGVIPDQLSSTVLTLGLPGEPATPLGHWLADAAAHFEPVVLTLANLRRWPRSPLDPQQSAFVIENPSLIAETARRQWTGPPLICSSGRPTMAVIALIRQLAADGATVYQHADFDPAGVAITAWLAERAGTTPWRMTRTAYLASLAHTRTRTYFEGVVSPTPWDPALEEAMAGERAAVYEESLVHLLDGIAEPPPIRRARSRVVEFESGQLWPQRPCQH